MDLQHAVEQFLYRQSELLDTRQWQAWIDLFADDGVYWMPADGTACRRSSPRTRT
jgi:biphenyl 2,3-dioxygenase subunit beta